MNSPSKSIPTIRIQRANNAPVNPRGKFVLYWMIANRRPAWNYSLDRAVNWARELNKPLVILEALRLDYPWASERLHSFVLDGMADHVKHFKNQPVTYYPYVETAPGAGKGLLTTLTKGACVVVTDDFPAFFLPHMTAAAAKKIPVLMEQIDSNGLLPMSVADHAFPTAYAFRRFLQRHLPDYLAEKPKPDPLKGFPLKVLHTLPKEVIKRWPMATEKMPGQERTFLNSLPLNHPVGTAPIAGGSKEAKKTLKIFLKDRLHRYVHERNQPQAEATSGLSPYLHFGHISVHEIFHQLIRSQDWSIDYLSRKATGGRSGWWSMDEAAEAFLDQLVIWRELGFNMCLHRPDYDQYESLPQWVRATLSKHEKDQRPYVYTFTQFEKARTHDPLWNAAQTQLIREGRIHNYLRMLWGKKILHWSPSPREALDIMIEFNNKYALDGRDPNSYSGIFWILGRYDRAWGPERAVFGKVRYMSSANTQRKLHLKEYLRKWS